MCFSPLYHKIIQLPVLFLFAGTGKQAQCTVQELLTLIECLDPYTQKFIKIFGFGKSCNRALISEGVCKWVKQVHCIFHKSRHSPLKRHRTIKETFLKRQHNSYMFTAVHLLMQGTWPANVRNKMSKVLLLFLFSSSVSLGEMSFKSANSRSKYNLSFDNNLLFTCTPGTSPPLSSAPTRKSFPEQHVGHTLWNRSINSRVWSKADDDNGGWMIMNVNICIQMLIHKV